MSHVYIQITDCLQTIYSYDSTQMQTSPANPLNNQQKLIHLYHMQTVGAEIGFIPRGTSIILSMNNKGPQIDPWGIPVGRFRFLVL